MEKSYRYTVAGHPFTIVMPAELEEELVLKPYLPFKVNEDVDAPLFSLQVQFVQQAGALPVGTKVDCFNEDAPYMWLFESGVPNKAVVPLDPLGRYVYGFSNTKSHSGCYLFTSPDHRQAVVCLPYGLLKIFQEAAPGQHQELSRWTGRGAAWLQRDGGLTPLIGGHRGNPLVTDAETQQASANVEVPEALQRLYRAESEIEFILTNCMMLLYTVCTASQETLLAHASVVKYQGKGYMFLGKSGTGKSTHSSLWLKYIEGAELLNDDNPAIRIQDGQAVVSGTPWSGKTPCYRNEVLPLGGIVRLKQAPENRIGRLGVLNSFAALMPSCSCMKWDHDSVSAVHKTLEQVVMRVPVYGLDCRPDEEAARVCREAITAPEAQTH